MPMPRTLTLVRHGESESNAVKRAAEQGAPYPNESRVMKTHTSRRRLTTLGVMQAIRAGEWLRAYFEEERVRRRSTMPAYHNVRGYVSPYVRAMETAGRLDLPITWRADARLSERNWGELDQLTYEERVAKYGSIDNRELHGIFWPAGNGESLQMLGTRMWQHFHMLAQDHETHDVVEVSHGETILTQRFMLERWLPEDVVQMMLSTDSRLAKEVLGRKTDLCNKIINCRIIQYTRECANGSLDTKYCRVRLVAPDHPEDPQWSTGWMPIVRKEFSTDELLKYVEKFPHLLQEAA